MKPGLINERMDCVMLRENIDVFPVGFVIARCFLFRKLIPSFEHFFFVAHFYAGSSSRIMKEKKNGGVRACQGAVSSTAITC